MSGPFRNVAALLGRPGMSAPCTEGCWFPHPLFRPTKSTPPSVPLGPDESRCLRSPPQPLSFCPPGSRTEELFPDSLEPRLRALDPHISAPPGVKGMLSNLWNFSVRNKHFRIPFWPPELGTQPIAWSPESS